MGQNVTKTMEPIDVIINKSDEMSRPDVKMAKTVTILDGIETIPQRMFYSCKHLTTVTISKSVKNIDEFAFSNCPELTTVHIPSSVIKQLGTVMQLPEGMCHPLYSDIRTYRYNPYAHTIFFNCEKLTKITTDDEDKNVIEYWNEIGAKNIKLNVISSSPVDYVLK